MQSSLPGIPPPLSSRAAAIEARVFLTPEGRIHHAEIEVRSITGSLLHALAVPASIFPTPAAGVAWVADRLTELLEQATEPF